MKLYTGKGDKGETGILGNERLSKDHNRIEAYGTIDELNSTIGILIHNCDQDMIENLRSIQSDLFEIGTELASSNPKPIINVLDIQKLEKWIDAASNRTPELTSFILPGGSLGASWFHLSRTICRRAERRIVTFGSNHKLNENILTYINRLSDLFFAWARLENYKKNISDIPWESRQ